MKLSLRSSSAGLLFTSLFFGSLFACSSGETHATEDVRADQVEIVHGVADRGGDPAVIAIDVAGRGLCTGTLIAPDVVLTAHHCVADTTDAVSCPPSGPQIKRTHAASSLAIYAGDDVAHAQRLARGREILVPNGNALCDADIALVILDAEVDAIEPVEVRVHGVAAGEHVRAVGFGKSSDGGSAGVKLVREHVKVLATSDAEFRVGEATCQGDSGGPAFDEETGELVGVVSRGGPTCRGKDAHNIYTRTDAFMALIDEALAKSGGWKTGADAGAPPHDAGKHRVRKDSGKGKKPASDLGAACQKGGDCAAGVCVTDHSKRYCSRPCDAHDHCPTHFKCTKAQSGSVCVEK